MSIQTNKITQEKEEQQRRIRKIDELEKTKRLAALNSRFDRNSLCELKKTALQAVPGEGNPNAKVIFIGEAPGKKEDQTGRPFIGSSGKFLTEMLGTINMERQDVFITSILKYRPPDNRDPSSTEIATCLPWLIEQIKLIEPVLVVFLGRHALHCFFPAEKISDVHGKLFSNLSSGIPGLGQQNFLALYHPAAALYNRSLRKVLIKDFSIIPKLLTKFEKECPQKSVTKVAKTQH